MKITRSIASKDLGANEDAEIPEQRTNRSRNYRIPIIILQLKFLSRQLTIPGSSDTTVTVRQL